VVARHDQKYTGAGVSAAASFYQHPQPFPPPAQLLKKQAAETLAKPLFFFLPRSGTINRVATLKEAAHGTYRSRESTPPTLWKADDAEAKTRSHRSRDH
jgi:hypothetical protein